MHPSVWDRVPRPNGRGCHGWPGRPEAMSRSQTSRGQRGPDTQSPRLTVRSTSRRSMSASTASSAGRFPWMSAMTAIRIPVPIALDGMRVTIAQARADTRHNAPDRVTPFGPSWCLKNSLNATTAACRVSSGTPCSNLAPWPMKVTNSAASVASAPRLNDRSSGVSTTSVKPAPSRIRWTRAGSLQLNWPGFSGANGAGGGTR